MRHALILAAAAVLTLSACALTGGGDHGAAAPPAAQGLGSETIEVSPLDAPAATTDASVAETPAAALPEATDATPAEVAAVPITEASDATPHPRQRPGSEPVTDLTATDLPAAVIPPAEPPKSQPQLLCEAAGGTWGQFPDSGVYVCQKPTGDGGRICRAKTDCQGECLARSGTCAPVTPLLGCNEVLDSQGRMVTLCLD